MHVVGSVKYANGAGVRTRAEQCQQKVTKRTIRSSTGNNGAVVGRCKRCSEAENSIEDDCDNFAAAVVLALQPVTHT